MEALWKEANEKVSQTKNRCDINKKYFHDLQYAFVFEGELSFGISLCGAPRKEGYWVSIIEEDSGRFEMMFHFGENESLSETQRGNVSVDLDDYDIHILRRATLPELAEMLSKSIDL